MRQLFTGAMWGLWGLVLFFVGLGIASKFTDLGAGNGNLLLGTAAAITVVALGTAFVKDRAQRRAA